jgi:hypothetical protein
VAALHHVLDQGFPRSGGGICRETEGGVPRRDQADDPGPCGEWGRWARALFSRIPAEVDLGPRMASAAAVRSSTTQARATAVVGGLTSRRSRCGQARSPGPRRSIRTEVDHLVADHEVAVHVDPVFIPGHVKELG